MKLPNILTLCRLLGAPLFLWAFLDDAPHAKWIALALVIAFELTDFADGYLARRLKQVSQLGKIIDPLADSVSRFTVFLAFLVEGYASVWAIALIFYRDSIVSTVRILAASLGVIVSARWSGKLKAITQAGAIIAIVGLRCMPDLVGKTDAWVRDEFAQPVMWAVASVTLLSLLDYVHGNRAVLAKLDR